MALKFSGCLSFARSAKRHVSEALNEDYCLDSN